MSILSFAKKITGAGGSQPKKTAPAKKPTPPAKAVKTSAVPGKPLSKPTAKPKGKVKKATAKGMSLSAGRIKLAPMLTEKSVILQARANAYAFRVVTRASKGQIARAIQDQYGVKPVKIRTMTMSPKARRRGRTTGFTSGWKKAYVTFPAGKGIDHGV